MSDCKACGRDIAGDMLFCPYCGTRRTMDSMGKPLEGPSEKIMGIIPFITGEGRLEGDWTLIVTEQRLIFAFWPEGHGPKIKTPGLMVFAHPDPDSGTGSAYALRYNEMGPDDALRENVKNFYIFIRDVQQMRLGQRDEDKYLVKLTVAGEDLVFQMPKQHDARNLLLGVLREKTMW